MKKSRVVISIADIAVEFRFQSLTMKRQIEERYEGFSNASSRTRIIIAVEFDRRLRPGSTALPAVTGAGEKFCINRKDFCAGITGSKGHLVIAPSIYSFDAFLRVLYATLLPMHDKVLVHAAAVVTRTKALVFPGPSGYGKTTLATLAGKQRKIINDEIVILGLRGTRGITVQATPFWGGFGRGTMIPQTYLVKALCFPVKSRIFKVHPVPPGEGLLWLLKCCCTFAAHAQMLGLVMDVAGRIAARGLMLKMHFARNPKVWEKLDKI